MKNDKQVILYKILISLGIIIVIVALGVSFAYFSSNIQGTPININGGASTTFDINLVTENDGYINAPNLTLIEPSQVEELSEKASFKVLTGNNEHMVSYALSLTNLLITENLQVSDFKWQLICLNDASKNISGTFNGVNTDTMIIKADNLIGANSTDQYEFRIWLEENYTNQLHLMDGSFSGKFSITANMIYNQE